MSAEEEESHLQLPQPRILVAGASKTYLRSPHSIFNKAGIPFIKKAKPAPDFLKGASDFRLYVHELTESKTFGGAILFVILLNTVTLIAQTWDLVNVKAGRPYKVEICELHPLNHSKLLSY